MLPVQNPWVLDLLKWHGHDSGGVRVPFQEDTGNPLGSPIETDLLRRLRSAARAIAMGESGPRAIFLVGGPGNGKSEAVQVFLEELGEALDCKDELKRELERRFKPSPVSPPIVELIDDGQAPGLGSLWKTAGKLTIIQDASATAGHAEDASEALVSVIEAVSEPGGEMVLVCCLNRGLLSRAIETAGALEKERERSLLSEIASRTGLGLDALGNGGRDCWPMTGIQGIDLEIGAWPLDLESLIEASEGEDSPLDQLVSRAVEPENWCTGCEGCPAREGDLCPFFQNASDLRDPGQRRSLLKVLRSGEIATGQRWNFRDSFSLIAGLVVGEQDDFTHEGSHVHPCEWVQSLAKTISEARSDDPSNETWTRTMRSTIVLSSKLYPHALFTPVEPPSSEATFLVGASEDNEKTRRLWLLLAEQESRARSFVETYLAEVVTPLLSPELCEPGESSDPSRRIEDSYSQAVELGNVTSKSLAGGTLTSIETRFLESLVDAEAEWDPMARESSKASEALRSIRKLASAFSKRSLGTRQGWHAKQAIIEEYIGSLRSAPKLGEVRNEIERMLGRGNFSVDAMSGFGRLDSGTSRITLQSSEAPKIRTVRAPAMAAQSPSHDMPSVVLDGMPPIPLTFALFEALTLRRQGCRAGSLPPVLATVLGKLRQLHASKLSKELDDFVDRRSSYFLGDLGQIVAGEDEDQSPILEPGS